MTADGNIGDKFAIQPTTGKVYVAQSLDWEQQVEYSLNISITDGPNTIFTQVWTRIQSYIYGRRIFKLGTDWLGVCVCVCVCVCISFWCLFYARV